MKTASSIYFFAISLTMLFSCQKDDNVKQYFNHPKAPIFFTENPKIILKDCNLENQIQFKVYEYFVNQDSFEIKIFMDGELIHEYHSDFFIEEIDTNGFKNKIKKHSLVESFHIPPHHTHKKDKSTLIIEYYGQHELIGKDKTDVLFLDNGEIASYCDYNIPALMIKCGGRYYFTDEELYSIEDIGDYIYHFKSTFKTYREKDGRLAITASHEGLFFEHEKNQRKIPIPSIPDLTYHYPKELILEEGTIVKENDGRSLYFFSNEDYGKYPLYGHEEEGVAYFRTVEIKDCTLEEIETECLYIPSSMRFRFIKYPDSIPNKYF